MRPKDKVGLHLEAVKGVPSTASQRCRPYGRGRWPVCRPGFLPESSLLLQRAPLRTPTLKLEVATNVVERWLTTEPAFSRSTSPCQ